MASKCKSEGLFLKSGSELETQYIETGNIALDMVASNGKGLPVGGYVVLVAAPGSGKTTSVIDLIKRMILKHRSAGIPFSAIFVDIEGSKELGRKMGLQEFIDSGELYYKFGPTSFEDLDTIATDINEGNLPNVKLLVIDSMTLISCASEEKSEAGDFGNANRARYRFYKIFLSKLKLNGVTCVGISQVRAKQQAGMYEDPKKAAIADGDLHYADIILKLQKSSGGNNTETKKIEVATTTSDKVVKKNPAFFVTYKIYDDKNRFGNFPEQTTLFKYGKGADNWYILSKMLIFYKYLVNKGSAGFPKFQLADELTSFVGQPLEEDANKKQLIAYLRSNLSGIKDFLKSKDEYVAERVISSDEDED